MSLDALRRHLAELVAAASDGEVTVAEVLAPGASLAAHGLSSLGYLRLIDAVEAEFGVELDLSAGLSSLDSVDDLAAHLHEQGLEPVGD